MGIMYTNTCESVRLGTDIKPTVFTYDWLLVYNWTFRTFSQRKIYSILATYVHKYLHE